MVVVIKYFFRFSSPETDHVVCGLTFIRGSISHNPRACSPVKILGRVKAFPIRERTETDDVGTNQNSSAVAGWSCFNVSIFKIEIANLRNYLVLPFPGHSTSTKRRTECPDRQPTRLLIRRVTSTAVIDFGDPGLYWPAEESSDCKFDPHTNDDQPTRQRSTSSTQFLQGHHIHCSRD